MFVTPEVIEARKKAACLIRDCLFGRTIVREALKQWPDFKDDPTLMCARHALIYYESDEELRQKDSLYADQQIEWLENLIHILSRGDNLPLNIIESYKEYYEMPISIKGRVINFIMNIIMKLSKLFKPITNFFNRKQN